MMREAGGQKVLELKRVMESVSAQSEEKMGARTVPIWKRALDLTCLLVALPTVLPLMLLIAAFIKIVAPGPVFFRQKRVGFLGQTFDCLKFRTM